MLIDPISHLTTNYNEFQQGPASLRRLRAIEAEAVGNSRSDRCQAAGSCVGACGLEGVWFGLRPDQNPCCRTSSSTAAPGRARRLGGQSEPGKSTLFSPVAALNTAQRGRCCSTARTGRCAPPICAVPIAPWCPSRAPCSPERWQRRSASDVQPSSEQVRQAARLANAADLSKPWPWLRGHRNRGAGSQFFPAVNCTAGDCPRPCSATRPCCLLR